MDYIFFFQSALLGLGLAMDAFSVSVANGLNEPRMKNKKAFGIAGTFAFFQAVMPLLGWVCVHSVVSRFKSIEGFIPWIALLLLAFIGGKMIYEGLRGGDDGEGGGTGLYALILQGIATSIDALSVGFTIAGYGVYMALMCALIISAVTFVTCLGGVFIGKKAGGTLAGKAGVLGGLILIAIGIEIFVKGVFF